MNVTQSRQIRDGRPTIRRSIVYDRAIRHSTSYRTSRQQHPSVPQKSSAGFFASRRQARTCDPRVRRRIIDLCRRQIARIIIPSASHQYSAIGQCCRHMTSPLHGHRRASGPSICHRIVYFNRIQNALLKVIPTDGHYPPILKSDRRMSEPRSSHGSLGRPYVKRRIIHDRRCQMINTIVTSDDHDLAIRHRNSAK
ncbi:hypothetical protein D3C78_719660 [compost metagenome]